MRVSLAKRVAAFGMSTALLGMAPAAGARTWYVRAGAHASGRGSAARPFASLAAVQAASRAGDTIIIETARAPLDGGILLKARQRLIGAGPAVAGRTKTTQKLPAVENTSAQSLDGDAIRLGPSATVRNIAVRGAYRGDIYGLDSPGVTIVGNDISGQNASCTKGFLVQPFNVPTGVPSFDAPASPAVAPQNGWAGIMLDGQSASGSADIERNFVHDASCGDGIDIRAMGSSDITARVKRNTVTRLAQGSNLSSVLAIGMQALDAGVLHVAQDANTETDIGSSGADCEGEFANTAGSGVIIDNVDHNTFRHAIGGTSCNGFETIISSGGGTIVANLRNSTFTDNVGDMFEEGNLGTGSTMHFLARNVLVRGTSVRGGNPPGSSDGGTNPIPFNIGDCMVAGDDGSGDSTTFVMDNSVFEGCNNGLSLSSNVGAGNGSGPAEALVARITHSVISHNAKYGMHVVNATPLNFLHVSVFGTAITANGEPGASFEAEPQGTVQDERLDLGGGALGSPGGNCLYGNASDDVEATVLSVSAMNNWWGHPGTPSGAQTVTREGGSVSAGGLARPPVCGLALTKKRRGF